MKAKERSKSALLAVFPTAENFAQFTTDSENTKTLHSFCRFAFKNGLIEKEHEDSLKAFLQRNSIGKDECRPPENIDFESFLDQKEAHLELKLSMRALTDQINALIESHQVELPKVSNSMLSRLKKEPVDTPHKQNVLRSLSFWIGYERGHLPEQWNYETLLMICNEGGSTDDHKEGVRIGFALSSRGEVIDHEIVRWLKKVIKSHIEHCIKQFAYGRWGKVRAHDITTLYVDFPKKATVDTPEAYRQCLRSAISLCHQICIRWVLSEYHCPSRFLAIGIAAGDYDMLDNHLFPILSAKLPTDPVVRLTDYARQCVLINDIRVISCSHPAEITLYTGENLTIWWLVGFWSTLYFDFIPDLLKDDILGDNTFATKRLSNSLWISAPAGTKIDPPNGPNAVSTFFKYPQNSMLGLEIAKTLYFRRRFWEAIEILRIVLSLDPTNIIARTLRMMVLCDLSLDAPTYAISKGLFARAHNEALFMQQNCAFQTEDFFCGHAIVYLAQAMLTLRYLREGNGRIEGDVETETYENAIFENLQKADTLFGMGDMVSSTGIRSYYMQKSVKIITAILRSNPAIFRDPGVLISSSQTIVQKPAREFQWQYGYFKVGPPIYPPGKLKARIFRSDYLTHEASIALQAHRPSFYFGSAVAWWDFLPQRTVRNTKIALKLLQSAKEIAEALKKKQMCTYSFTRTYGEMMPAEKFISHMNRSIEMIKMQAGKNLNERPDSEIVELKYPDRMSLLLTLNF